MGQKEYYEAYFDQFSSRSDDRTRQRVGLISRYLAGKSGQLLQVSCGNGLETLLIKEMSDFQVSAVDISERALASAKKYGARVFQLDIETQSVEGVYDLIVCFEVLEHLVNPKAVLERLASNLREGGLLIVSLPNEFHAIRRLQFVLGVYEFARYDWHHLRFFSYREARRLIRDSGLATVEELHTSLLPPRMLTLSQATQFLARLFPSLFAFSFLFVSKKAPAD